MARSSRFRALDRLAALMASQPPAQPAMDAPSPEPVRESSKFVITQAQILMMASACLSAQEIADCLDRDGVEEARVRHE